MSPPLLWMFRFTGALVNTKVTFPPPDSVVTRGANRSLPFRSPPPVKNLRVLPRSLAVTLPPPVDTLAVPPTPDTATSPPPLSSVTSLWMPLTCMLPPPVVSWTAVSGGTSSVAFSPQLPVGRRQSRWRPSRFIVRLGRMRLYWTVPTSRALLLLASSWCTVTSPPPVLATRWPPWTGMVVL